MSDQDWKARGHCYQAWERDPDLHASLFADNGPGRSYALRVCNGESVDYPGVCPVRRDCGAAGAYEFGGVWGGQGDRARQRERPARRQLEVMAS
jgi:hypothetical protein